RQVGVDNALDAPLGDPRQRRQGDREHVERQGDRLPVKVAAREHVPVEHHRVVGGRVQLHGDQPFRERDAFPHGRQPPGTAGGRNTQASWTTSAATPVWAWVPFTQASPSFASRAIGSSPRARTAPPSSPSPTIASAKWASGARSPDAPTLPCDGTRGCTRWFSI